MGRILILCVFASPTGMVASGERLQVSQLLIWLEQDPSIMLSIRKRWPVVAGATLASFYGINQYQLDGLENVHLTPRSSAERSQPTGDQGAQAGYGSSYSGYRNDLYWEDPTDPSIRDSNLAIREDDQPRWSGTWQAPRGLNDRLSLAEKLAVWEENRRDSMAGSQGAESRTSSSGGRASGRMLDSRASQPFTKPIPAPPGLGVDHDLFTERGQRSFPVTTGTDTSTAPNQLRVPDSLLGPKHPHGMSRIGHAPPLFDSSINHGELSNDMPVSSSFRRESIAGGAEPLIDGDDSRIRIATFHLSSLDAAKLAKPSVIQVLVRTLRQYDIVALQGIESSRDDVLPTLVKHLKRAGRTYDYLIGPRVGREDMQQQFAFLFDIRTVETDRYALYTVDDPQDLITYEPLVAWFRCKLVPPERAFTFSLINTRINPDDSEYELGILPQLLDAVERDGRQEDDWILLGDLQGSGSQLATLDRSRVRFVIQEVPTDVQGQQMLDSMFFPVRATTEYTGRSGVFDFLRKHNLSLEAALEVSNHLPVWAEFSAAEGGRPGHAL